MEKWRNNREECLKHSVHYTVDNNSDFTLIVHVGRALKELSTSISFHIFYQWVGWRERETNNHDYWKLKGVSSVLDCFCHYLKIFRLKITNLYILYTSKLDEIMSTFSDRNVRNYVDNINMNVDYTTETYQQISAFLREHKTSQEMEKLSFLTKINYSELMMEKNSYEN